MLIALPADSGTYVGALQIEAGLVRKENTCPVLLPPMKVLESKTQLRSTVVSGKGVCPLIALLGRYSCYARLPRLVPMITQVLWTICNCLMVTWCSDHGMPSTEDTCLRLPLLQVASLGQLWPALISLPGVVLCDFVYRSIQGHSFLLFRTTHELFIQLWKKNVYKIVTWEEPRWDAS